ncbi:MAG: class I SAM-dependent methyltransferase, partial [Bacteroidota bacterium]|nr:class I SAM-dependent methyltransferase [Bacteroidota bacterium]
MNFLQPTGEEIINMLHLKDHDVVLDVATGTGEPGLTIASRYPKNKVIGTDLSEDMLAVAQENAMLRGIPNFYTECSDISQLPFEDETFDAISCRFGFMFFPDIQMALSEMIRVLKPTGRIAASVWNHPEKNLWIATSMQTMMNKLQINPPPPGAPGIFRCADPDYMSNQFIQSGLQHVEQREVSGILECGNIDNYWGFMSEVACPAAFKDATQEMKDMIKAAILAKISARYT